MKLKLRQFKKELVGTGSIQYVLFPKPIKWLVNLSNKLQIRSLTLRIVKVCIKVTPVHPKNN